MARNNKSATTAAAKHLAKKGAKVAAKKAGTAVVGAVGWPAILIGAAIAIVIVIVLLICVFVVVVLGGSSQAGEIFGYQCQSRLGASIGYAPNRLSIPNSANPSGAVVVAVQPTGIATSSATTTSAPPKTAATTTTTPAAPSSNPFASLSVHPSAPAEERACMAALRSGSLVAEPALERTTAGTPVATAARKLADEKVVVEANAGSERGPEAGRISNANFIRYAITSTSSASSSSTPTTTQTAPSSRRPASATATATTPTSLAELIALGARIDPSAISAGDVIYYNFTASNGPTAAMIAITPTTGITADTPGQPLRLVTIPTGNVVVKRTTTP